MGELPITMKQVFIQSLLICLFLVAGCTTGKPNLRTWESSNLVAKGWIKPSRKVTYHSIRIGTDERPYDGQLVFAIRLSNGIILSSDDFSEPTIRKIILTRVKPDDRIIKHDSETSTSMYWFDGVSFTYREHRLIKIVLAYVIFPEKAYIPEIAKTKTDTFIPFRIPEENLRQIFGPPDEIHDRFSK